MSKTLKKPKSELPISENTIENQSVQTPITPKKASDFKGVLSTKTAEELLKYIEESRKEWDDREEKQWTSSGSKL